MLPDWEMYVSIFQMDIHINLFPKLKIELKFVTFTNVRKRTGYIGVDEEKVYSPPHTIQVRLSKFHLSHPFCQLLQN